MKKIILALVMLPSLAHAGFFERKQQCRQVQICEYGHCRIVTVCN